MDRPRYPNEFKTKRELLWYVKGLMDAKQTSKIEIEREEERYLSALQYHMDFDKEGNVLSSSVQPD